VGDSTAAVQGTVPQTSGLVERAHAALLKQTDIQFTFRRLVPPQTPAWLKPFLHWLGHVLLAIAPAFKYIFWGGIIIGAVVIAYFLFWELAAIRFGWRRRKPVRPLALDEAWTPTAAKARTLIEDADRLAREGRYDAAIRLILFRSIEDIDQRWPGSIRPAQTSRDIAGHPRLTDGARNLFAGIARVVERNVFGGAPVGETDFKACREAYANFALPAGA
jgi:hypothetical protein